MTCAIIQVRGGSERIPRKNIRLFHGKPIIAWPMEAALQRGLFDEVMVSTDDEEIAVVARQYGAAVSFFRSAAASDDHATTVDVLAEVLHRYAEEDRHFDAVCCIYPTAPFVDAMRLRQTGTMFEKSDNDVLLPVARYGAPIERALVIRDGKVRMPNAGNQQRRSHDFEPVYRDAGQLYWFRVAPFLQQLSLFLPDMGAAVVSELEAQHIDSEEDCILAEMKFSRLKTSS